MTAPPRQSHTWPALLLEGGIVLFSLVLLRLAFGGGFSIDLGAVRIEVNHFANPLTFLLICLALWINLPGGGRSTLFFRNGGPRGGVWGLVLLYALFYSVFVILQHHAVRTTVFDLGIFENTIWNTSRGRWFWDSIHGHSYLGDHFSPILLFLVPLHWVSSSPLLPLVFQTLCLAVGAVPVARIGERAWGSRNAGLIFAACYLSYPTVGYINQFDIHAITFAIPLLCFAALYLVEERYSLMFLFLGISLLCKEEMGLVAAMFGLHLALFRRKHWGWLVFLGGVAYTLVVLKAAIPFFRGEAYEYFNRYGHLGGSPEEIARSFLLHPVHAWKASVTPAKIDALVGFFRPLGWTSILSPAYLLPALPTVAYSFLSAHPPQMDPRFHYWAPAVPFIIISGIFGSKVLLKLLLRATGGRFEKILRRAVLSALLLFALSSGARQLEEPLRSNPLCPQVDLESFERARRLIPPGAPLLVANTLGAHLARREHIFVYLFPGPFMLTFEPEYILVDLNDDRWTGPPGNFYRSISRALTREGWGVRFYEENILLMERGEGIISKETVLDELDQPHSVISNQ